MNEQRSLPVILIATVSLLGCPSSSGGPSATKGRQRMCTLAKATRVRDASPDLPPNLTSLLNLGRILPGRAENCAGFSLLTNRQ